MNHRSDLTHNYIERIFTDCKFLRIQAVMEPGDTMLVMSDGVSDNLGDISISHLVAKAWDEH